MQGLPRVERIASSSISRRPVMVLQAPYTQKTGAKGQKRRAVDLREGMGKNNIG